MKKFLIILPLLCNLMAFITACQNDDHGDTYFWSDGEKIPLQTMNNKLLIVFKASDENKISSELAKNGLSLTDIKKSHILSVYDIPTESAKELLNDSKTATIQGNFEKAKSALSYTIGWSHYYILMTDGRELTPSILIIANLKNGVDKTKLETLAQSYNIIFAGTISDSNDWYQFLWTNDSKGTPLEIANRIYNSGLCNHSYPSFGGLGNLAIIL